MRKLNLILILVSLFSFKAWSKECVYFVDDSLVKSDNVLISVKEINTSGFGINEQAVFEVPFDKYPLDGQSFKAKQRLFEDPTENDVVFMGFNATKGIYSYVLKSEIESEIAHLSISESGRFEKFSYAYLEHNKKSKNVITRIKCESLIQVNTDEEYLNDASLLELNLEM